MSRAVTVAPDFDPVPAASQQPTVTVAAAPPGDAVIGILMTSSGDWPDALPDREVLAAAGFTGARGQTLLLPGAPLQVAVGVGDPTTLSSAGLRDTAAAFALAATGHPRLALRLDTLTEPVLPAAWVSAAVEGIVLARYEFTALRPPVGTPPRGDHPGRPRRPARGRHRGRTPRRRFGPGHLHRPRPRQLPTRPPDRGADG